MKPTAAMKARWALLRQWAVLRHHGVHGFRGLEPVTDPGQATSLSLYEYRAQEEPREPVLGPLWPHYQSRHVRWVAVKYGATWWVSTSDRAIPWSRDWRRVGKTKDALAYIAKKLQVQPQLRPSTS